MSKKTLLILGAAAVAAYFLFFRKPSIVTYAASGAAVTQTGDALWQKYMSVEAVQAAQQAGQITAAQAQAAVDAGNARGEIS